MTDNKVIAVELLKELLDDFSAHHGDVRMDLELIGCIAGGWGGGSKEDNLTLRDGLQEIINQIEENWSHL